MTQFSRHPKVDLEVKIQTSKVDFKKRQSSKVKTKEVFDVELRQDRIFELRSLGSHTEGNKFKLR
jgi:hypothetical protein